jgi:phage anti-repressor protein
VRTNVDADGFVEGVDFTCFNKIVKAGEIEGLNTTVRLTEYIVTLDTAKHIAML